MTPMGVLCLEIVSTEWKKELYFDMLQTIEYTHSQFKLHCDVSNNFSKMAF